MRRDELIARDDAEWNIPFDESLGDAWTQQQNAVWQAWHAQQLEAQEQKKSAWWTDVYKPYMASEAWQERRSRRLARDAHSCQAMLDGCTQRATDVHHLHYKHFGNEPLFDLISVCRSCHDHITDMDQNRPKVA